MLDPRNLSETTEYLFNCNFFDEAFDPDGNETHQELAEEVLDNNLWQEVFTSWNNYLRSNCTTPETVINFCNLFVYYGGTENPIRNPYDFLGYIFAKVNLDKYWDVAGELLDGIAIAILRRSGEISLTKNPCYQSWKDPKLIKAAEKYKTSTM
ncbi:MAG: hypothetical protein IKW95_08805 [Lachnospiraceae bacterium]|nr:hypothetical protein [Lachnospiraceae bacterium]